MRCPICRHPESKVLESREAEAGNALRRRRECLNCHTRFTTYERVEASHLMVVKKDGKRELFNRDKLADGIYKAFEKRSIPAARIEQLINEIEQTLRTENESEVTSHQIGSLVMEKLMVLDDVAYVRFASVYRSFRTIRSFETELAKIKKRKEKA